jgi:SAM-dependent methyltransferase
MKFEEQQRLSALVRDNYHQIAPRFDVTRQKPIWPEVRRHLESLVAGSSILDVGCGNGRLVGSLPPDKSFVYLGVDNSPEMLARAIRNYPGKNFKAANILSLTEAVPDRFDLVVAAAVLHHLPGEEQRLLALRQLGEVTKKGGKIIISVWRLWPEKKYAALLWRSFWLKLIGRNHLDYGDLVFPWKDETGKAISSRYYHAFTRRGLKRLVLAAGFKDFKIFTDQHNYWIIIKR